MKVLISILIGLLVVGCGGNTEKIITIDQNSFSKIYPAVYFSPSDGEISPIMTEQELMKKSDSLEHLAEKFEVWIEPRDPEFGIGLEGREDVNSGFIHLGSGLETFNEISESKLDSIGSDKSRVRKISRDMMTSGDQPVFLVKGKDSRSIIIIISCDPEAQKIQFKWKKF